MTKSKKMKRYRLEQDSTDGKGVYYLYPYINASNIKNQKLLNRSKSHFTEFFPSEVSFDGMFPTYGTEHNVPQEPHALCDMHAWIERKPRALVYPISPAFKDVLISFNIPEVRFYNGSVVWRGKREPYYVMHLLTRQFQYIDFANSSFVKCDFEGSKKSGTPAVKGSSMEEVSGKFGAESFTFERAVMQPEFRELDMYHVDIYGMLIADRLKNAIESANLTGVKITECPIEFEFSDEI